MKTNRLFRVLCLALIACFCLVGLVSCGDSADTAADASASAVASGSQQEETDVPEDADEAVLPEETEAADDTLDESGWAEVDTSYEYDDQGRIILQMDVYSDYTQTNAYAYDEEGQLISQTTTLYMDGMDPMVQVDTTMSYDDRGNLVSSSDSVSGMSWERTYNDDNLLTYDLTYYDGEPMQSATYEYSEDGVRTQVTYESLMEDYLITVYVFPESGDSATILSVSRFISYCDESGMAASCDYYDADGNLLEEHGTAVGYY